MFNTTSNIILLDVLVIEWLRQVGRAPVGGRSAVGERRSEVGRRLVGGRSEVGRRSVGRRSGAGRAPVGGRSEVGRRSVGGRSGAGRRSVGRPFYNTIIDSRLPLVM